MLTPAHILSLLDRVTDPEIPVINVRELGVLRDVQVAADGKVTVTITPTYTGCPAMDVMAADIKQELHAAGIANVEVKQVLSPAWSTDQITEEGKRKLKEYGIAPPPHTADIRALKGEQPVVNCPHCGSRLSAARRARRCGNATIAWSPSTSSSACERRTAAAIGPLSHFN